MSTPFAWPLFTARGHPRKANVLPDATCLGQCFNSSDFDNDLVSQNHSESLPSTSKATDMQNPEVMEILQRKALNPRNRYSHPTFPSASFLTTLLQPKRFEEYISNEFPSLNSSPPRLPVSTTNYEALRKDGVKTTVVNSLLNTVVPTAYQTGITAWVYKAIFPDESLPVPFNEACLDDVQECWDNSRQQFSNFPETMGEKALQDWLNHLAHTLGVRHGLIKEREPKEVLSTYDDEDDGVDGGDSSMEEKGFVIADAEDRSFSMVSHGPTGLIKRNLCHFLKNGNCRPRWHHIEAIVEVSLSASHESMVQQILEKAALMFETQPFRRFALGLALRGTGNHTEFCLVLVDRAGVCRTMWTSISSSGYEAINLARIVFGLSYAKPEFLGADTSMTVDFLSGNVAQIKVKDQEFNVVKHIYSSRILFGRGTHVFLVQDKDGKFHILKDAWLLADHGISEIDILSTISDTLKKDTSADAEKYRGMHPRFVIGEEIGDSTNGARRGRLANKPPERLHRRVVTGPVGDPLTSFRSREEFVKVLLDCVDWLEYLHKKCCVIHGDLSINNIVIYRTPPSHPPPKPSLPARTTRASSAAAKAQAPTKGLTETIPVTGVIIDYDYAHKVGAAPKKISGTLPFMPIASLDKGNHGKYIHSPAHDLESLLQTILGVVTFTAGPCGQIRAPTDHVPLARWYNEIDLEQLYKDKAIDVIFYEREIHDYLPDYWKPFSPYLRRLVHATWPQLNALSGSAATHDAFREILKEALASFATDPQETPANYARVIVRKRSLSSSDDSLSSSDEVRYTYKRPRGDVRDTSRLPRLAVVRPLSQWMDSVDTDM